VNVIGTGCEDGRYMEMAENHI